MALDQSEKSIVEILAKYAFIEHCKEEDFITIEDYTDICNSWGDKALEIMQYYLKRLKEYHEDTGKFVDELKRK